MKAIGLRARAVCNEALRSGNGGKWYPVEGRELSDLSSRLNFGVTFIVPPFPLHSSWRPPNKIKLKEATILNILCHKQLEATIK